MLFQWAAVTFSIHTPFKVLFFVKNIGQWNAKSGPKAAYGNFAMRKKNSGSLKKKWKRKGRNGSHFAHTHTHSAKLVVRIIQFVLNRPWNTCWSAPSCHNRVPTKTWNSSTSELDHALSIVRESCSDSRRSTYTPTQTHQHLHERAKTERYENFCDEG